MLNEESRLIQVNTLPWWHRASHQSPLNITLILIVALFLAEFGAAFVVHIFPRFRNSWVEESLDAFLTLGLASPALYHLAFRPLQQHLERRRRVEEELRRHREDLERTVAQRTAELRATNQELHQEITERTKAEATLRQAKEEWERTFHSVPDLIALLDDQHRVLRANRAMAQRLGRNPEECIGLVCYQCVHGTDRPPPFCPHSRSLKDGQEHAAEVHEDRLGGDFLITTTPLRDAAGRTIGSVHVARDITEQKRAEAALRESEEQFRTMFELAAVGMAQADSRTGHLLRVNERFCALTGYAAAELIGKPFSDITHPDDRERDWDQFQGAVRGETPDYRGEQRYVRKDGAVVWVEVNVGVVRDASGQPLRTVAAILDITERKAAEEALRRHREWLRVTLTSIGDAVMATDTDGKITFLNPVAERLTGWPQEEALGQPVQTVFRIVDERTHGPAEDIAGRVLRAGSAATLANHTVLITRDGREIPIDDSAAPIKDEAGHVAGAVLVFHDVTEKRRAQQALRDSEERLRLAVRAADLGVFEWDVRADRAVWENRRMYELFGQRTEDGPLDKAQLLAQSIHPDDMVAFETALAEGTKPGHLFHVLCRIRRRNDGEWRWLEFSGRFECSAEGAPVRLLGVVVDITERKRAEAELRQLNRTLKAISNSSQALLRAENEAGYLDEVCQIVVRDCGHAMVWIGFAEEDEGKTVRPVAHAGLEEGYLETLRITWADAERGQGPTGTAIRTGKPSRCTNMLTDPKFAPWREQAVRRGYASSLVLPLLADGKAFGALTIYLRQPGAVAEDELKLLSELADDLASGITAIRWREAHRRAEEALRRSNGRLDLLAEAASELLRTESPQTAVSALCRKLTGFLDCQAFFNFQVEPGQERLHLNDCDGIPEAEARRIEWLDCCATMCGRTAQDGCRLVADHILDQSESHTALVKSYGLRAYACHPLVARGRVLGTLSFGTQTRECFADEEVALMKSVADLTAIAMERKRAEEDLARTNAELERRVAERTAELQEKSRFLEAFFQHSLESLVFLDKHFNFIRVNQAYARACQREASEFPGHNHFEFYPHPENQAIFEEVVRTKTPFQVAAKPFAFPDHPEWGVSYWDWTLVPILDAAGETDFLCFSLRDVSERRRAEAEVERYQQHLEELVQQRTLQLKTVNTRLKREAVERRKIEKALRRAHDELENIVEERTADLRRANQTLQMLSECNKALVHQTDERVLVRTLCRIITEVGGYVMAWVGLAEAAPRRPLRPLAAIGYKAACPAAARAAWAAEWQGRSPTATAIRTGKVCLGRDFLTDRALAPWREQALRCGYRSSVALPLRSGNRVLGALTVYAERRAAFDADQVVVLSELADDLAFGLVALRVQAERDRARQNLELKTVQLRALAAELTQAEQRERRRLATVLHDHLQQLLVGARYGVEMLRDEDQTPRFQAAVQRADLLIGQCLQASRTLTAELSPPVLYEAGFVTALQWLGRWLGETHGLTVVVTGDEPRVTLPEDIRIALFQAVRELLFNVVKHAQVKKAQVRITHPEGRQVRIVVADDGVGFDPRQVQAREGSAGGFGLFSVRERLQSLGITLTIDSAPGRGSRFTVLAPLPNSSPTGAPSAVASSPALATQAQA